MLSEATKPGVPMRAQIGINAHLLSAESGYRRAGIHQYINQVLDNLPLLASGSKYLVFSRHASRFSAKPGFAVQSSRWPTEKRVVRISWEQTAWPLLASYHKLDLLHSMAFVAPLLSRIPTVITVYDLSFIHFPQRFPTMQRTYLQSQTARSCRRARRVITISESGRRDVHRFFQVPLDKIDVVLPGVDPLFRPLPETEVAAFRRREHLPQQVILHVGTLQPHKNIPMLLEALARLARPEIALILAGGKGWLYQDIFNRVAQLGLQKQVRFTGYIADEDLPLWYNSASILAFPSVYEGFGMPVVEAMACGTPVVAAKSSSIPEACGEAALYFNPENVGALTDRLSAILDDTNLAAAMRKKGLAQARLFSWQRAGQETAHVYRRALAQ
jgi:glycosyltransferase involved in cell wall biosynthesis